MGGVGDVIVSIRMFAAATWPDGVCRKSLVGGRRYDTLHITNAIRL